MKKIIFILFFLTLKSALSQSQGLPARLVSLKPNITQSLIELGLKDKIVGITRYCERPNPAAEVIGDYNSFDIEKIIRLKADLVITSSENTSQRDFAKLLELKIPTLLLNFNTWHDLLVSLDELERRLLPQVQGHFAGKQTLSVRLSQDLTGLRNQTTSLQGKNFVVIIQRVPLMVAGKNSFVGSLLEEIGLKNIFRDSPIAYPTIDEENFIREGPDLVFELSHELSSEPEFLGQKVVPLKMEEYLAAPKVLSSLEQLISKFSNSPSNELLPPLPSSAKSD